jgi:hypothetical protein
MEDNKELITFTPEQLTAHDMKEYGKTIIAMGGTYLLAGIYYYRKYSRKLKKLTAE